MAVPRSLPYAALKAALVNYVSGRDLGRAQDIDPLSASSLMNQGWLALVATRF